MKEASFAFIAAVIAGASRQRPCWAPGRWLCWVAAAVLAAGVRDRRPYHAALRHARAARMLPRLALR